MKCIYILYKEVRKGDVKIMVSDYRQKTIRNEARRLIGKYNDEELEIFVKSLSSFINGNNGYVSNLEEKDEV
jgi:hypothetical protein|tara:strand:- start:404 stop:619 length:216 start_codon:yes stop_codon:yes gene_type:complete